MSENLTLAEMLEMRKDLMTALGTGAKRIKTGERETEFQSVSQMQKALNSMNVNIDRLSKDKPRTTLRPFVTY